MCELPIVSALNQRNSLHICGLPWHNERNRVKLSTTNCRNRFTLSLFFILRLTLLALLYLMVNPVIYQIGLLIATSATHIVCHLRITFSSSHGGNSQSKFILFRSSKSIALLILFKSCLNVHKGSDFGGSHDHLYDHWHSCYLIKDIYMTSS